jgi:hypothetical protein
MPLQSKRTVKVQEIPAGTSEKQYLDFVEHLCTKPQKPSKSHFSRVIKHFRRKSKSPVVTSASASGDELDEDAKSKDETKITTPASGSRGESEQAVQLLNSSQPTAKRLRKTTFCFQNGQSVGTISFENEGLKREALARHKENASSCWKVEDNFDGITILHDGPNAKFE